MKISKDSCEVFREIIDSLYEMRSKFFYNKTTELLVLDTFKNIISLKKTARNYVRTAQPNYNDFKRSLRKTIKLIDKLLINENSCEINNKQLRNLKEQLELLYIMIELV